MAECFPTAMTAFDITSPEREPGTQEHPKSPHPTIDYNGIFLLYRTVRWMLARLIMNFRSDYRQHPLRCRSA